MYTIMTRKKWDELYGRLRIARMQMRLNGAGSIATDTVFDRWVQWVARQTWRIDEALIVCGIAPR